MNKYVLLDELMVSVYSVEIGLTEEQAEDFYVKKLKNIDYLNKISNEIYLAFVDKNFSWSNFFDEHDIYTADSEDDAKKYAERIILAPLMRVAEEIHKNR